MEVQVEVDADSRSKELHINADSRPKEPHINADSRSEEPQGDADGESKPQGDADGEPKPQGDADGESKPQGDADGESKPHLVQKDLWGKKYKVLKRKCEEFEQVKSCLSADTCCSLIPMQCGHETVAGRTPQSSDSVFHLQFNEALFHRAKRIHQMIERAEAEKRYVHITHH